MHPRLRLITTFGLGFMKPASGTWGSLPPAIYAAVMVLIWATPTGDMALAWYVPQVMMLLLFSVACVRDGDFTEHFFYKKDPSQVVADETAGMALTLVCAPPAMMTRHGLWAVLAAFVLFRIMDIIKPAPAYGIQRMPGGWGVLLDDLVAAVYAAAVLWAAWMFLPGLGRA